MEAVAALRKYIIEHKSAPKCDDKGEYDLGGVKYHKDTVTPVESGNKALTLASLVHGYEFADSSVKEYLRDARAKDVMRISQLDKPAIVAYLNGETDWTPQIKHDKSNDASESGVASVSKDRSDAEKQASKGEESKKRTKSDKTLSPEELLLRKIKRREGCQRDRDSILQSSQRFVEALLIEKGQRNKKSIQNKAPGNSLAPRKNVIRGRPIIVVPATMSAVVNMFNVKPFLESGTYLTTAEARKTNPSRSPHLYVDRILSDNGPCQFKVVDSVKKFQDHHWERLAAVFTQGPKWQFKDWRWHDTATIFENCRGIHVHFDDHKLESHLLTWNVVPFPLKKQSRHSDALEVHKIWLEIEQFLATKKPDLLEAAKLRS